MVVYMLVYAAPFLFAETQHSLSPHSRMGTMALLKGKYMPLSEANVGPVLVSAYDGQSICVASDSGSGRSVRYAMGNYLGGGIAGDVYEAFDTRARRQVAIKILNPVGYKLCSPATLRRAEVVKKGVPVLANVRGMTLDNVFWVALPNRRDLLACYVDARSGLMRELTLEMCVSLWLLDADEDADDLRRASPEEPVTESSSSSSTSSSSSSGSISTSSSPHPRHRHEERKESDEDDEDALMLSASAQLFPRPDETVQLGDVAYTIPAMPAKYKSFLQSRRTIYREIAHMHKLTGNSVSGHMRDGGHANVLKLFDVLELIQPSKSTIFLVLELAAGGELFDRIRSDNGVEEDTARAYFAQLLAGVRYCHQLGIVHRDLKPENLLLSDSDVLKIADFGLSAHFIAAVSGNTQSDSASALELLPESEDSAASVLTPLHFRRLNSMVGSPHYVAPEVLQNARYGYDGRKADMWSVGVILYGLLAGSLPFGKDYSTCPRYLKFCEWIRSLPYDAHTGKLMFEHELFAPPNSHSAINTSVGGASPISESFTRLPQVHPCNNQQQLMPSNALLRPLPTEQCSGNGPLWRSSSASQLLGAGPRRGSRVVSFPSWLFPANLSAPAVYLLSSLLHPDPSRRFSCEDAFRARWLAE